WMHHKGRNKHHFEYWTDYNIETHKMEAVEMPLKYVKEMFCDRVAAGKIYLGDKYTDHNPIDYFEKGNAKNMMHPKTAKLLEGWLRMLLEEGESKTFAYIKSLK
ncbi:MAG: catalase, partial [Clostridia bacterium]|nr:catalase [Clostridia bacterium]